MADSATLKGAKIYICATAQSADLNQAGYEALPWVQIVGTTTLPTPGTSDNIINLDFIDQQQTEYQKGLISGQQSTLVVSPDPDDAGQNALRVASESNLNYAFYIDYADETPDETTGTIRYFRALVGRGMVEGAGPEDFVLESYPVNVNGTPVVVYRA
jgi:hypothetical protein